MMDEHELFELVARLRPEAAPDPTSTERHRSQLEAAIATSHGAATPEPDTSHNGSVLTRDPAVDIQLRRSPPSIRHHGRPRLRRYLAVAAAAAVVGGVGYVALQGGGRGTATRDVTLAAYGGPSVENPVVAGPRGDTEVCGPALPFTVPAPDGYAGPTAGPGADSLAAPLPASLVQHWAADGGTVEVRWPAEDGPNVERTAVLESETMSTLVEGTTGDPRPTPSGRHAVTKIVTSNLVGGGACGSFQYTVAHDDPAVATLLAGELEVALVGEGGAIHGPLAPLVVGDPIAAEALPEVIACNDPGVVPARQDGTFTAPSGSATPADALAAFLVTVSHLVQRGYTRLDLPDGSVGFAAPLDITEGGSEVIAAIHATETPDGWKVDDWHAPGC